MYRLYSATHRAHSTVNLVPSFCRLCTEVLSDGVASVDITLTTLLSFQAVATKFPHWRKVDCPRLNLLASSLISLGYSFRLVRMVPHAYVPSSKSFDCRLIEENYRNTDGDGFLLWTWLTGEQPFPLASSPGPLSISQLLMLHAKSGRRRAWYATSRMKRHQ